jgi:hypothetical protein
MTTSTLVAIIVVAIVCALGAWMYLARQRRTHLRHRFGPEYDRAVDRAGDIRRAEAALEAREKRVSKYPIRPLTPEESGRFAEAWRRVQALFVDAPARAVTEADALVGDVMRTRGYPMSDFDQRAEDLSVDHPKVIHHYREAHTIAVRHSQKNASTEDLRQALVHYRALFDDLLEVHEPQPARRKP